MVKRLTGIALTFCMFLWAGACSSDDDGCRSAGTMSGTWSDGQELKFNDSFFTKKDTDTTIGVQAYFLTEYCRNRIQFSISDLHKVAGRQNLVRYNDDGILGLGTTSVTTLDHDAITELYFLDTLRPHYIDIDEIGNNTIRGVLNATYIVGENEPRFWSFADTLYFNNTNFEWQWVEPQ